MATISEMVIKIGADASGLSAGLNKAQQDINKTFSVNPVNEFSDALTGTTGKVDKLIGSFSSLAKIAATGFGLSSLISGAVEAGSRLSAREPSANILCRSWEVFAYSKAHGRGCRHMRRGVYATGQDAHVGR